MSDIVLIQVMRFANSENEVRFVREGRSGPNVCICSEVRPQERPLGRSFRDQGVVMQQGSFCGCVGTF